MYITPLTQNSHPIELSVIIPCFNEENNIPDIVPRILKILQEAKISGEIILIDDGSIDNSRSAIEAMVKQCKNVLGIHHEQNFGITEAWNTGIKHSRGKYVVTIDADFQYAPECIHDLYRHMIKENCDLVQGWRKNYKDSNLFRRFLSKSLSWLLNLLFFTRLHDIKSGFVISKQEVFAEILKERKKFRLFQHFFILCALKKGYCLQQIPVAFYPRKKGRSFISNPVLFSLEVLLELPKAIIDFGFISKFKKWRKI